MNGWSRPSGLQIRPPTPISGLQPRRRFIHCKFLIGRAVWPVRGVLTVPCLHRILMDVIAKRIVLTGIADAAIKEAALPDIPREIQLTFDSKREVSLDELQRPLQSAVLAKRNQQMKMVRHDHPGVKRVSFLFPIVIENVNQQPCHALALKQALLLLAVGRYEVSAMASSTSMRNGHFEPQGLKPRILLLAECRPEGLLHPGFCNSSDLGVGSKE